jgi:hypothetical protein
VVFTTCTQPRHRVAPVRRRECALHALDRAAFCLAASCGAFIAEYARRFSLGAPETFTQAGYPYFMRRDWSSPAEACQMKRDHLHQTTLSLVGLLDEPLPFAAVQRALSVPAPAAAAPAEGDMTSSCCWQQERGLRPRGRRRSRRAPAPLEESPPRAGCAASRLRWPACDGARNVRRPGHHQRLRERCGRARHGRAGSRCRSRGSAGGASVRGGELRGAAAPAGLRWQLSGT